MATGPTRKPGPSAGQIIHYYSTCWNEEYILPHFLAHHRGLYDRVVLIDDGSTDQTLDILARDPRVEVRHRRRAPNESYIEANTVLYNEMWKESRGRADWVVVGNVDEFLFGRDLRNYLADCTQSGITVVPSLGFEMVDREPIGPGRQLLRAVRKGAPLPNYSRLAIFNPDAIVDIGYSHGRHKAAPTGDVFIPARDRVLNLHYKHVGLEKTFIRFKQQELRRQSSDRRQSFGHQYAVSWNKFLEVWTDIETRSFDVFDWYRRQLPYPADVWWRTPNKALKIREAEGARA